MKKLAIFIFAAILISGLFQSAFAKERTVYLKYNLKYDANRNKASCVNYQNGLMVPFGTKVKILSYSRRVINLEIPDGTVIKMAYSRKYTGMKVDKWIDKVTSVKDPTPQLKSFSKIDREGIEEGKALIGMTKKAVVIALGYPPVHRTRTLKSNRWVYWANRVVTFGVRFSHDKVVAVGAAGR